ncbi:MarR family transcriptional regulator [Nocardioides albidus]|uniref:MarR family transcriptional regulator n=1 Tax=Nocardioides albidus TaxID=1517589 RepID=A0A5C4VKF6_9ACTN|nr:MarR family transcriptional regulator [Nocardioides albidus]TNM36175.1 MarR family transcriptional regulator [Nocardioides albidus]
MSRRQPGDDDQPDAVDAIVAQWAHERPDLDATPIALFGRIHRVYLRYQTVLTRVFGEHGLNSASFDVLAALRRSGAPYRKSGRELADGSLLSSAGVTFRLDRLEAAGLIVRQRDADDRRVVHSQLTDEGLALIDASIEDHLRAESALLKGLTLAERAELARLLAKLERSIVAADRGDEADDGGSDEVA